MGNVWIDSLDVMVKDKVPLSPFCGRFKRRGGGGEEEEEEGEEVVVGVDEVVNSTVGVNVFQSGYLEKSIRVSQAT